MLQLADAAEQRGALMRAAQTHVAASLPGRHGLLPKAEEDSAAQRALRLLETKLDGDSAANQLELDVLSQMLAGLSSMNAHVLERMEALQRRRAAARSIQASHTDLVEVGQAALTQLMAGVYKTLKTTGFGTAEDAKSAPTAAEFAEAAATLVALTRARVGTRSDERALVCETSHGSHRHGLTAALCCAHAGVGAACRRRGCR